ncbi:MAG: GNAT family N-acetyltransferase [Armatimonadetes bacterium]|nr:GNAT family N-acetyltransferase [Armatimonadota bacterium]
MSESKGVDLVRPLANAARMTRRIRMLKDAGLLARRTFTEHISRAITPEDLREAYRLVHDVYVEQGYILPHRTGLRVRVFEALPHTATFIAKDQGEIVGTMSLVLEAPGLGLPSEKLFREEIRALRANSGHRPLCEVSNLAVRPEYRRTSVFYELIQPIFAQAFLWKCSYGFISICPKHAKFFQDVIQFDPWGDCRTYCEETNDEVVGMSMDLATIERRFKATDELLGDDGFLHRDFFADNPFIDKCREWELAALCAFRDSEPLRSLLIEEACLLERCSDDERECLRIAWGPLLSRTLLTECPDDTCEETRFGGIIVRVI